MSDSVDVGALPAHGAHKISIDFEDFSYTICQSNKKLYVVKRRNVFSSSGENTKDLITI